MIEGIVLEWNVLTVTMAAWAWCVCVAVAVDFGPEIYRENRARAQLAKSVALAYERRRAEERPMFDPDKTFQLGVYKIQPQSVKRPAREGLTGGEIQ